MSDIKLLVFNNGIQILGDVKEVNKETHKVVVKKPVQLVMVPRSPQDATAKNEMGMAFAPFMQYSEEWTEGVPFSIGDLLTILTPVRDLKNNYSSNFGSGIVLPPPY